MPVCISARRMVDVKKAWPSSLKLRSRSSGHVGAIASCALMARKKNGDTLLALRHVTCPTPPRKLH
eukprot:72108-Pleurochrysis_carterae.AAC.2